MARDPNERENLHVHELRHETKLEYKAARADLEKKGYVLQAVVLDGRKGIPSVFKAIPVQICHFHQWKIVRKYLTLRPKLESHKALLAIAGQIAKSTEEEMASMLLKFAIDFKHDLEEHVICPCCNKPKYVHRKLRSAYRSLIGSDTPERHEPRHTRRHIVVADNQIVCAGFEAIEHLVTAHDLINLVALASQQESQGGSEGLTVLRVQNPRHFRRSFTW